MNSTGNFPSLRRTLPVKNSNHERLLRASAIKLEQLYFASRKNSVPVGGLIAMLLVPLAVLTMPP